MSPSYTLDQFKQILSTIDKIDGWDFSRVNATQDPPLWDYADVVRQYLTPTSRVLDIGTGGGELFFSLASDFGQAVAIDQQAVQIESAQRNLDAQAIDNVELAIMDASDLRFAAESFDVVLTSHLRVFPNEIWRVLRPGGYFVTETVGQRIGLNILTAFGWTPASFGREWWQTADEIAEEFKALGGLIRGIAEYDVPLWYQDIESVLFYIMSVPWPEKIVIEKHWQQINRYLETSHSERGFESNDHYGLLVVQKPHA